MSLTTSLHLCLPVTIIDSKHLISQNLISIPRESRLRNRALVLKTSWKLLIFFDYSWDGKLRCTLGNRSNEDKSLNCCHFTWRKAPTSVVSLKKTFDWSFLTMSNGHWNKKSEGLMTKKWTLLTFVIRKMSISTKWKWAKMEFEKVQWSSTCLQPQDRTNAMMSIETLFPF